MVDETETEGTDNTDTPEATEDKGSVTTETPASTDTGEDGKEAPEGSVTTETAKDEPAEGDTEAGSEEGAPDAYGDFTLPEGFDELDKDLLAKADPLFKEAGLNQERAQSFIDLFASTIQGQTETSVNAFNELNTSNVKACEDHADFGGDRFDESKALCAKAIDQVFGKENAAAFRQYLDETGAGNHPLMFELMTKVGKAIGEDGIVDGDAPNVKPDRAERMYGKDGKGPNTEA